ncbi:MAG: EAL domain-containing protein [Iodobacter sp.]
MNKDVTDLSVKIERIFTMSDDVLSKKLVNIDGMHCNNIKPKLQSLSTLSPYISKIIMFDNAGSIFCSSDNENSDLDKFPQNQEKIFINNDLTERSTAFLKNENSNLPAIALIDLHYIYDALKSHPGTTQVELLLGNQWVSGNREHNVSNWIWPSLKKEVHSSVFPITIISFFDIGLVSFRLLLDYPLILLVFFLLSSAGTCFYKKKYQQIYRIRKDIKTGLANNEFHPWFQPLVDAKSGEWIGAEVLVRWIHPDAGIISPDQFIPEAEKYNLSIPITTMLMEKTAHILNSNSFPENFSISFNISTSHLRSDILINNCTCFLAETNKVKLVLELTENEYIAMDETITNKIASLSNMGILIAIDDFGTGYATLDCLGKVNAVELKIDKSFVNDMLTNPKSACIIDNVLSLASALNMIIVAEGIETTEQKNYLILREVDLLQGYLFSKPVPEAEFFKLLNNKL